MKPVSSLIITILCLCVPVYVSAQVPGIINYQGRVIVNGTNFDGTGQFRFALVNNTGATTYWSNGVNTLSLAVTKGLYSVLLGDTGIPNMGTSIPVSVFTNDDVRLRVWFNNGVSGLQQLSPDQRLAAVGYAMMAATVPNGAVSAAQLASNAVTAASLAPGAVTTVAIANGAVGANQLASNSVNSLIQSNLAATGVLTNGAVISNPVITVGPQTMPGDGQVVTLGRTNYTDHVALVLKFPMYTNNAPPSGEWRYGLDEVDGGNDLVLAAYSWNLAINVNDYIRIATNGYIGLGGGGAGIMNSPGSVEIFPNRSQNTLWLWQGTNGTPQGLTIMPLYAGKGENHNTILLMENGYHYMYQFGSDFAGTNGWDFFLYDWANTRLVLQYTTNGIIQFGGNTLTNINALVASSATITGNLNVNGVPVPTSQDTNIVVTTDAGGNAWLYSSQITNVKGAIITPSGPSVAQNGGGAVFIKIVAVASNSVRVTYAYPNGAGDGTVYASSYANTIFTNYVHFYK